jgi:ABC-type Fe3+/spermidine/putrescine transport system ATPase subunit
VKNLKKAAVVTMVAGGLVAAGAGLASADSHAAGAAQGSPGVVSGNTVQAPVHVPVNATGDSISVIGRNGVGKSTTLKSVMGLVRATGGEIHLNGEAIAGLPPHAVARRGIGYVPEERLVFPTLTVTENLSMGVWKGFGHPPATSIGGLAGSLPAKAEADNAPLTFMAAIIQSGPFRVTDGQNLAGIRFAVDELNAKGGINGHPVQLDVIDTELNAAVTRRKAVHAVLQEHVAAIIGASGSDILRALVSVGQQYHVPVIAFAGETDELTGEEFLPVLFRGASSTTMHAAAVVYGLKQAYPEVRKVFLLNEDYSFGHASADGFAKALARLDPGVQVVGNVFHPRGIADFSPYLQQIQAADDDLVLTADWGGGPGAVAQPG